MATARGALPLCLSLSHLELLASQHSRQTLTRRSFHKHSRAPGGPSGSAEQRQNSAAEHDMMRASNGMIPAELPQVR